MPGVELLKSWADYAREFAALCVCQCMTHAYNTRPQKPGEPGNPQEHRIIITPLSGM